MTNRQKDRLLTASLWAATMLVVCGIVALLSVSAAGCGNAKGRSAAEFELLLTIGNTGQTPRTGAIEVYVVRGLDYKTRGLVRDAAREYALNFYSTLGMGSPPKVAGAVVYLGKPGDRFPGFPRADLGWSVTPDTSNKAGFGEVRMSMGSDFACRGLHRALWWSLSHAQKRFTVEAAVIADDDWIYQQILARRP